MSQGIWSAASGADAQLALLDGAANNAANASTVGYRADRVAFAQALKSKSSAATRYVARGDAAFDGSEGGLTSTGRPLDVAIRGDGYFAVQTAKGDRFTRAGQFDVGQDGVLRTRGGDAVLGENGRTINCKAGEARIDADGTVRAGATVAGKLKLVTFTGAVTKEGAQLFNATPASGQRPLTNASLAVGTVEGANVSVVSAMVDMVTATRAFEACEKAIETFGDADHKAATTLMGRD